MTKMPQISAQDITGVAAYMPTTTRTNIAIDRNTKHTVDLDEAARAADVLVRDGATSIVLNGTFGELASLTLRRSVGEPVPGGLAGRRAPQDRLDAR